MEFETHQNSAEMQNPEKSPITPEDIKIACENLALTPEMTKLLPLAAEILTDPNDGGKFRFIYSRVLCQAAEDAPDLAEFLLKYLGIDGDGGPIKTIRNLIRKYDVYNMNPDNIKRYKKAYEKDYRFSLENLLEQISQFK